MARKLTDEQEAEIARRYAEGEESPMLAHEFSVCAATVRRIVLRRGGTIFGKGEGARRRHGTADKRPSRAALRELYMGRDKPSCRILSRRLGVTVTTVVKWLREARIPVRSAGEQLQTEYRLGRLENPIKRVSRQCRSMGGRNRQKGVSPEQRQARTAAFTTPAVRAKIGLSQRRQVTRPCTWCGRSISRKASAMHGAFIGCSAQCSTAAIRHHRYHPTEPRPLILARFTERMAELRKAGLPIGAATLQKAAEPIGASEIERESYLAMLTPREMDEYLDNQLEHDVRAAGL